MKTLITEDQNKVIYKFNHNDCDRIVTYSKTIYIENEAAGIGWETFVKRLSDHDDMLVRLIIKCERFFGTKINPSFIRYVQMQPRMQVLSIA